VVKLLVEMIDPYRSVYDACSGSGTFIQSERLVENHAGNTTTSPCTGGLTAWRKATMNFAIGASRLTSNLVGAIPPIDVSGR
jgi:type I restriction-modification system DNA methylase subunit